jgi:hypothetical protein
MPSDISRRVAALEEQHQAVTARPQVVIYGRDLDDAGVASVMTEHFQRTPARLAVFFPDNGRDPLPVAIPAPTTSERGAAGMGHASQT